MRSLKNSGFVHDTDYTKFPEGAITNETESKEGTPVIEEVYGDILQNFYEFIKERGIVINELQDNKLNGYQFIQALKRNVNVLNDIEQLLVLNGTVFFVDLNFSILPNKYFFFAKATSDANAEIVYTIKGQAETEYSFNQKGFKNGDELLIIFSTTGVNCINISPYTDSEKGKNIIANFGFPIPYLQNQSEIWYSEAGKVFDNTPVSYDLKQILSSFYSLPNLFVYEIFLIQDRFVCCCFDESANKYRLFWLHKNNPVNPTELIPQGFLMSNNGSLPIDMFSYFDGENIYFTHNAGSTNSAKEVVRALIDFTTNKLVFIANITLDNTFVVTTNIVAKNSYFLSLISGSLNRYNFDGTVVSKGNFDSYLGYIYNINKETFYTNGETSVRWLIQ